ncbi:MAG: threonine ammonia-lyase, biosynthetic [Gammaproteobacteria bacterium]|nr:MAG: threonine ammonia-lyase, biosynthetic [Gammaproteobacteria bacterium]
MSRNYLEKILNAHVYQVAHETPLDHAVRLSERLNNRILLKREDLQPVFSFKLRGACNKLASLGENDTSHGVVAASAGNHAQGLALSARNKGIKCVIFMPVTTPTIKVNAVRQLGAQVILSGDNYDEASKTAQSHARENNLPFIHPYDDPDVIAGQGTVAMEILQRHHDPIHAIFVPVGGGGLIAGIAVYVKTIRPDIRIIGVEPDDAPCMHQALLHKRRIVLPQVGIFADGVAVKQAGKEPYRLAKKFVDEIMLVSADEMCAAIKDIYEDTRAIVEPAGALAVAGVKKYTTRENLSNQTLVAINSGANMNFDRLRHVAERAELGEQREALLAVTIPEKPGSFARFCRTIGKRGITEFNYRFADKNAAHVFAGIELTQGESEKKSLISRLGERGYEVQDLSSNEMAKLHIRYMVGGHAPASVTDEKLYRFEFPERPGALLEFLRCVGTQWNISLFHYRNHGADYGRVLMGIQVPSEERKAFEGYLKSLNYPYWQEQENPAYTLFLR